MSSQEVLALIEKLKPVETDVPLKRMGPDNDGGYVVPDDFDGVKKCFSPGVGMYSGFEKELADNNIVVYMADASVEAPLIKHENFHFSKKFIGAQTEGLFVSLKDWINKNSEVTEDEMVLQMDIEGYEYDAIESIDSQTLSRFRIILFEFHKLYNFWDPKFYHRIDKIIDALNEHHVCVHLHPNNCCGILNFSGVKIPRALELSFISKQRVKVKGWATQFPHPLDQDNRPMPHIVLPEQWHG